MNVSELWEWDGSTGRESLDVQGRRRADGGDDGLGETAMPQTVTLITQTFIGYRTSSDMPLTLPVSVRLVLAKRMDTKRMPSLLNVKFRLTPPSGRPPSASQIVYYRTGQ